MVFALPAMRHSAVFAVGVMFVLIFLCISPALRAECSFFSFMRGLFVRVRVIVIVRVRVKVIVRVPVRVRVRVRGLVRVRGGVGVRLIGPVPQRQTQRACQNTRCMIT